MSATRHRVPVWSGLSLARRFALTGGVVMLAGMLVIGTWVENSIEVVVVRQTAQSTAHYVDSVIAPLIPEFEKSDTLSPGPMRAMEEILSLPAIRDRVASVKIWKKGGHVVFATDKSLINKTFSPSDSLKTAWTGTVAAEFGDLGDPESQGEAALGRPLLEIYNPVRAAWSGEVIAVMEFYEYGDTLKAELQAARVTSWLVVGSVTFLTAAALFGIVLAGSRTIQRQQAELQTRIADLARLAEANRELGARVLKASAGAAETSERYLHRIAADLHDGPAQLLSLAALRLDSLSRPRPEAERAAETAELGRALQGAMLDIRNISRGLSLPELAGLSLNRVITRAVDVHRALTRGDVALTLAAEDCALPHARMIAIYRMVQEGLSNATRHAGGQGLAVRVTTTPARVEVSVSDQGPGLGAMPSDDSHGLGLRGMAERIESLGGFFAIGQCPGGGVRLSLAFDRETAGAGS